MSVYVCRTSQIRSLRKHLSKIISPEEVLLMTDSDVEKWFSDNGYDSYIYYTGEYDDSDDILIIKSEEIDNLLKEGKAFWATRSSL